MIAVPTGSIWENEAKDELRISLHEAGIPKTTCIWSDANASAMYDLFETAEKEGTGIVDIANKEEVRIVCDIGGLTVTHDADLSGAIKYGVTGQFRAWRPQFPLVHFLFVTSCPEMGSPDSAGVFEVRIPNLEKGGWVLREEVLTDNDKSPTPYVDIPYRLELLLEELMPKLKLDILTQAGGRLGDDMTWIIPLKTLYKHLTSVGDFKKKAEESLEEDVGLELEPAASGSPIQYTAGIVNPGAWYADENFGRLDDDFVDTRVN
ncbi:hypothetical protein CLCR_07525 [Cladophialophora carrionii]|uniref:Uncharacterized protein n=1 Tax=Cladophialophora carrionii TaxID=86049 RepID=A0A1C1CPP0_9EURO|nr:hypothetical protein CLCR_07525 [Cladophialophora carrionii]